MNNLEQVLKTYYGYDGFRPLQKEIILHTIGGGDSLVLMPTGGGKSLCFQMAALKNRAHLPKNQTQQSQMTK
jgi:ATP-dependent DNA helicase RecQ